jgi:Leucine-rich repeat (LRR) protein
MKIKHLSLLMLAFIFSCEGAFAQCYACETYEDALKSSSEVRMLQLKNTPDKPDARIAICQKLQVLFWEDSGLSQLPPELASLQHLTDLSLANNTFSDFPMVILGLKNLKVINLQGNRFDDTTKEMIRKMLERELPGTRVFL